MIDVLEAIVAAVLIAVLVAWRSRCVARTHTLRTFVAEAGVASVGFVLMTLTGVVTGVATLVATAVVCDVIHKIRVR